MVSDRSWALHQFAPYSVVAELFLTVWVLGRAAIRYALSRWRALRVVDWCNISGYDKWWTRFAKEYKEEILMGPPEKPFLLWGLFDLCRSEYALETMSRILVRAMDVLEICGLFTTMPWTDCRDKEGSDGKRFLSYDEYLPHAATYAFCARRLVDWTDPHDFAKEALSTLEKYQLEEGGWGHWSDSKKASVEVTAMAIHAIALSDHPNCERMLSDGARWLRQRQDAAGFWQEDASPDAVRLTVLALEALALANGDQSTTLQNRSSGAGGFSSYSDKSPHRTHWPAPRKRFKVALSFPGEIRHRVKAVAQRLANSLGSDRVFYDDNFKSEIATINADLHLQNIYLKESDLVVVWFGGDYQEKMWCGLEWRAIRQKIASNDRDSLMFLKVDDGDVSGMFTTDGYIDIRKHSDKEITNLVLERVRSNDGRVAQI
jgi:TIR domain